MADRVSKRKAEVKKRLIMFIKSWVAERSAAIFEIPIKLTSGLSVDDDDRVVIVSSDSSCYKGQILKPIDTFYSRTETPKHHVGVIRSVGACVSGTELYMFPDDGGLGEPSYYQSMNLVISKSDTLIPGVYDLAKKSSTPYKDLPFLPNARKMGPIVTVVGRELFALSAYSERRSRSPQPGFEAFHLDNHTWRELALCPIHKSRLPHQWVDVTGYVPAAVGRGG